MTRCIDSPQIVVLVVVCFPAIEKNRSNQSTLIFFIKSNFNAVLFKFVHWFLDEFDYETEFLSLGIQIMSRVKVELKLTIFQGFCDSQTQQLKRQF